MPQSPPPGSVRLTPDEAVHAITTSDHPEAATGSVEMDAALVAGIRLGIVVTYRFPDGRLAFTRED